MARMIPPVIDPHCPSPGEKVLFEALARDVSTSDWIVLHSLDVADHERRSAGEVDFVIIVPNKGVLCLEVKAHRRVRYAQGLWYLGNSTHPEARSPFRQASEAMRSIQRRIAARHPDLAGVLFWSAVAFTGADVAASSAEWHSWQLVDRNSLARRSVGTLVLEILDQARAFMASRPDLHWFHQEKGEPTLAQCESIAHDLRPDFEYYESPKGRRRRLAEELKRYTDDQVIALDAMEANPRVVFTGPAGSGKTLLAIEAARRSSARGQRTLLLCYNRLLGRWLEDQTAPLGPSVRPGTLHRYLLDLAGLRTAPSDASSSFWETELPFLAADHLLESNDDSLLFDEVILDEAQDLLADAYLDVLDLILRGGWAGGRWRLFGDFEKQAIYDAADLSLSDFRQQRGHLAPVYQLRLNCRNTPRIGALVRLLGGLDPDYLRILRPDDGTDASLRYYRDASDQQQQLIAVLEQLYERDVTGQEIVILSPRGEGSCASLVSIPPWRDRLRPLEQAGPGWVRFGTIQAFKGLEAPTVIVTDIEHFAKERMQTLFYVAVTRATQRLIILAHEKAKPEILAALLGTTPRTGERR